MSNKKWSIDNWDDGDWAFAIVMATVVLLAIATELFKWAFR